MIPDNWAHDGSLRETTGAWSSEEERSTYKDLRQALESAISDKLNDGASDEDYCYVWVADFTDEWVVYEYKGDLFQCDYSEAEDTIVLADPVKVRTVTNYVETNAKKTRTAAWSARESRKAKAELREKTYERRHCTPGLQVREAQDGNLLAIGCASTTEHAYEVLDWSETIVRGAFKRTLAANPDVVYLANHEGMTLARTTTESLDLEEDMRGLQYQARLQSHDPDVLALRPKLERGDMNESSFAFRVNEQEWDADYRNRSILEVNLHKGDVSVVNFGANDTTSAGMRALRGVGFEHLSGALQELRAGKALSGSNEQTLARVLELVAEADESVDEAQPLLAQVLGVANPEDEDEDSTPTRSAAMLTDAALELDADELMLEQLRGAR
jgi:hypothetical protein